MPSNQLRIAMLSAHSCPVGTLGAKDTGGMSVYIVELARELGRQGHLVDVYTRVHDPADPKIVNLGHNARLIHLLAGEIEPIPKLAVYSYLPDFACNLEAFRKDINRRYDLVFSHYWLSAWVGQYLEQWWSVPHITMFHTLGAVKNTIGFGEDEPELRIEREGELARTCHHIIAPTEKEKEALISHYGASPERISVVPCGVNLELFRPGDKESARRELGFGDGKIILSVGRIEPLKGTEKLIRALPLLKANPEARLVVIGGDESSHRELKKLKNLSRELGIEDSLTFTGSVKQDSLPRYYAAADVTVISSYYESFGLVALESLACGTPVVATDVGDLKNIIRQGETGYVVSGSEPHLLADKIDWQLSGQGRDALAVRETVSGYGWPSIARAIVDEFHQVLDNFCVSVP